MKTFSEMSKITNFKRNSLKKSFFPRDFEGAKSLKNCEDNSQVSVFVIYVAPIGAFFCTSVSPINGH